MTAVRSALYNAAFYAWTVVLCLLFVPLLVLPRPWMQVAARQWQRGSLFLLRHLAGLDYEVRGRENLPDGAMVIAAKHQSAWDTMVFHLLVKDPTYILKRELLRIPFVGWYLWRSGQIAIDRSAGASALKAMTAKARAALAEGRQIIIFPEGTRTAPGTDRPYQPGVAMLYGLGAPVVPVALNSGLFWGRNTFLKKPGVITIEILPPMPEGLDRRAFVALLTERIETASRRLHAEAEARFSHLR